MALKPFYNKKGHLGMTRAEVKAGLKKINDINYPAEVINEGLKGGMFFSRDNPIFDDATIELSGVEVETIFLGTPVSKPVSFSSYTAPWVLCVKYPYYTYMFETFLNLNNVTLSDNDVTAMTHISYTTVINLGTMFLLSATITLETSTIVFSATSFS